MNENKLSKLCEIIKDEKLFHPKGNWGTESNLRFYLKNLFKGIEIKDKTILDIGAGFGLFSHYLSIMGAKEIDALEPELEGGQTTMNQIFKNIQNNIGTDNINLKLVTFQEFILGSKKYDIILLHNTINHLNESACENLHKDSNKSIYISLFSKLNQLLNDNGLLIITDCSNKNLFHSIGVNNPLAPSIEWEKHQSPKTWKQLAVDGGFKTSRTKWTTLGILGSLGSMISNNPLFAFLTISHFQLFLKK